MTRSGIAKLRRAWGASVSNPRPDFREELNDGGVQCLVSRRESVVTFRVKDSHPLSNDVSGVDPLIDPVNRHALRCVVDPAPEVRIGSAIPRQVGNVQVDAGQRLQMFRFQDVSISVGDAEIKRFHIFRRDLFRRAGNGIVFKKWCQSFGIWGEHEKFHPVFI